MRLIPDGTRFSLPPECEWREDLRARLEGVLRAWGYDAVQTPALEVYDPHHPQAEKGFKLVDRDGSVLALRGDFTTAVATMVRTVYPDGPWPLRLRYSGTLWVRSRDAEIGRAREYAQVGAELFGVSTPLADAEIVSLVLEALEAVGIHAALELGHPGFVRAVLMETKLEATEIERLRAAIDRKNTPELELHLDRLGVRGSVREAVLALPDLYGKVNTLEEAEKYALNDAAKEALERLKAVSLELPHGAFLYDLGMARRYDYYTGMTFRAYTPDFGQPLVGGGRYDGPPPGQPNLKPIPAAGFAIGVDRLMEALGGPPQRSQPVVLALEPGVAQALRARGVRTELAWTRDLAELETYARVRGMAFLALHDHALRLEDGERVALKDVR
jgi:ATP phosphoribosyltransferase regulatory subunit